MRNFLFIIYMFIFISCSGVETNLNHKYKKHQLSGKASFYGQYFHKKRTASGEYYNMYRMTAAHKTLPFGAIVRVTNLENGKSIKVKINDRGPYVKGRIIDLSRSAFKKLAPIAKGVLKVKVVVIDDDDLFRYKH